MHVANSDDTITATVEQLRNSFLALPETNTPTGDRRDLRSDVTCLCGILYFCLTGQYLGQLRDENGKPPHRRSGCTLRDFQKDNKYLAGLDLLFDRGFTYEVEGRFQSCAELLNRMKHVLEGQAIEIGEPSVRIQRLSAQLRKNDAKTKVSEISTKLTSKVPALLQHYQKLGQQIGPFFQTNMQPTIIQPGLLPKEYMAIPNGMFQLTLHNTPNNKACHVLFGLVLSKDQIAVLSSNPLDENELPKLFQHNPKTTPSTFYVMDWVDLDSPDAMQLVIKYADKQMHLMIDKMSEWLLKS